MSIPLLVKGYEAAADTAGNLILAFAGSGSKVGAAGSNVAPVMGVGDRMGAKQGGQIDVVQAGLADVRVGGNVVAGDFVTADAQGRAVKAVPVNGQVVTYVGTMQAPGAIGDIAPILVGIGALS